MPPEPEPHIELSDDIIAQASEKAVNFGKKSFEEQKGVFASLQNQSTENSLPSAVPKTPQVVIKSLRTYQGDVAEAIKNQNASVLTIAMAEQGRAGMREERRQADEDFRPRTILERIRGEKPRPRTSAGEYAPPRRPLSQSVPLPTFTPPPVFNAPPTRSTATPQSLPSFPSKIVFGTTPQKKIDVAFRRDAITIAISILLILLGIGAVVGFYFLQKTPPKTATPTTNLALISYNTKELVSASHLDREALLQKMNGFRRGSAIPEGSIFYVELTASATSTISISVEELFAILKTNIPGSVLRAFDTQFMLGFYGLNGNQPFLLIQLSSFENAFAGMLTWEKNMNEDLSTLFSARTIPVTQFIPAPEATSPNKTATTTANTIAITKIMNLDAPPNDHWNDITIQNKDARVLKNSRAETILLYSFINPNTLLITSNESVLREMVSKFTSQQYVR